MLRRCAAACAVVAACGSSAKNGPDAAIDAAVDAPLPSFGAAMPQVLMNAGVILAHPKVMIISYTNDGSNGSACEATAAQLAASPAWATQTAQYGVLDLTAAQPQHIDGAIPGALSDANVQAMLAANLGSGSAAIWGPIDPSTIYEFLIPGSTTFDAQGADCCTAYGGYHGETSVGGQTIPYAVLCECPGFQSIQQFIGLVLDHETVEASTDPFSDASGNPTGWASVAPDFISWEFAVGGPEVGDMCASTSTALWTDAPGLTNALQRTWSNADAAAGRDPCVGDGSVPYYQTIPVAPDEDTIAVSFLGSVTTHLDKIAVGSSGTVVMHVYATPEMSGPFSVTMEDISGQTPPPLEITNPTGVFKPGDAVTFQVKVNSGGSPVSSAAEPYRVVTTITGSQFAPATFFYGLIGQ